MHLSLYVIDIDTMHGTSENTIRQAVDMKAEEHARFQNYSTHLCLSATWRRSYFGDEVLTQQSTLIWSRRLCVIAHYTEGTTRTSRMFGLLLPCNVRYRKYVESIMFRTTYRTTVVSSFTQKIMIKKLESAGLGFHVRESETKEMLGIAWSHQHTCRCL